MPTDWHLLRKLMNSALDACEAIEALDLRDEEQNALLRQDGQPVCSVFDALQSAHTFPESLRYTVIRTRGQLGEPAPFVQPLSRVINQAAATCAELVGAERLTVPTKGADPHRPEAERSIAEAVEELASWYEDYLVPYLRDAVQRHRNGRP